MKWVLKSIPVEHQKVSIFAIIYSFIIFTIYLFDAVKDVVVIYFAC